MSLDRLLELVQGCVAAQHAATEAWHEAEPVKETLPEGTFSESYLLRAVLIQHWCNYSLWHVEDIARRRDVGTDVIADCKYRIDSLNQERNDYMEKVDACLIALLKPLLPASAAQRYNTESLGMALDRLSILSLKIWHMDEQGERTDVDAAHKDSCASKAAVLREQRADLLQAVQDLMHDFVQGAKQPKQYYQFKMYNDPSLNPELYQHAKG